MAVQSMRWIEKLSPTTNAIGIFVMLYQICFIIQRASGNPSLSSVDQQAEARVHWLCVEHPRTRKSLPIWEG